MQKVSHDLSYQSRHADSLGISTFVGVRDLNYLSN